MTMDSTRRSFLKRSAAATLVAGTATAAPAVAAEPAAATTRQVPPGGIVASSYGWNRDDSGAALQNAINAALDATHTADTLLYVDQQPGDWITGPLVIGLDPAHPKGSHHLTIRFEPGVTVRAKAGAFDGAVPLFDTTDVCLITVAGSDAGELVSGITFDGYGATLAMNKPEYNAGEWRHALSILSADDITVQGLTIRDSGGDGIYLGVRYNFAHTAAIGRPYCSNITLRDVCCENHRRNAMTVISVDGLTAESCAFRNTFGTPPMAGIDFEPDPPRTTKLPYAELPYSRLKNIVIRNCAITDNVGQAVTINALCLGGAPAECGPIGITFENVLFGATTAPDLGTFICSVSGDNGDPTPITGGGIGSGALLPGVVSVSDSLIDSRLFGAAIRTQSLPDTSAFRLSFTRTAIWNDAYSRAGKYEPIALLYNAGPDTAQKFGGVSWTECVINTNHANPLIAAYPKPGDANSACTGLSGDLTAYVRTVGKPTTANISDTANSLIVTEQLAPAGTAKPAVAITTSTPAVGIGGTARFTFTRTGGDISKTLAVVYSATGDARERYDVPGMSGVAIFKPGETTTALDLGTRRPDGKGGTRTLHLEVMHADAYQYGATRIASVAISPGNPR
ncbi:twin-arginine translocation signal domain-containing protein [Kribbella sp.]|uniref:twin-arginine translocation signal domain-containing protein n=1 Tax=Kribbella sp. TaxID=1871183 RepID=UPI002D52E2E2|nr:right-handed parallel beta-helix repeat-containing protein [Kribbella sp.]HZX07298.1 right-handed parallel beta-helix repeat-containing protein [Kribbella sp.]